MMRRAVFAAFATAALLGSASPAEAPVATRAATAAERSFCEATFDTLGPITGDCRYVPLWGEPTEDDPWNRWDCRTMGNHICGETIYFNLGGELHGFYVNAPDRPACIVEPSSVKGGYEVIFYPEMSMWGGEFGFEVDCPM